MKKLLTALCLGLWVGSVGAKPVNNFEQAVDLVAKSVMKNKLTSLKLDCLMFMENETSNYYEIDIRENHNPKCGGDPETAPRLMSYQVNKKNGRLCTDSIVWAKKLQAEDPYDFRCRPIK